MMQQNHGVLVRNAALFRYFKYGIEFRVTTRYDAAIRAARMASTARSRANLWSTMGAG